ncbi:NAD(P)H-dependent flavin oxidoreductase [Egicoccus sp. AB-alg6-2]|uniref:NAD(P)H-dependent flavin oxidoreductase n=1 Tax=Egicoccus sp. AB-alg6-2 TaxID=3242692 RepID=UPI00359D585A
MTPFCTRLDLAHPIVQAPMAGVAHGDLAAAVSAAGGLGMLGVRGDASTDWVAEQAAIAARGGRFGVGLLLWSLGDGALLGHVLEHGPALVSLSFGDPAPYVSRVHDAGALVASQVQTVAAARQALDAGVDVLVAQGTEAGGHTGSIATLPLLQQVLPLGAQAGVPVLAAGGIATGRAVAGVLTMGADAAWIGTRFAATREAAFSAGAKDRILAAESTDTVLTHVFDLVQEADWPAQFPGRALRNRLTDRWHGREEALADDLPDVQEQFRDAVARDDRDVAHVYAGQASGLVQDLPAAAEVLTALMDEAATSLQRVAALLGDTGAGGHLSR